MMVAIERIREIGGGYVITSEGKVVEELALEVMGLITNRPHEEVDAKVEMCIRDSLGQSISKQGSPLYIPLQILYSKLRPMKM